MVSRPYSYGNSSQVIFRSLPPQEVANPGTRILLVQSLNSPFFPPPIGAGPGRAKRESTITCTRMLRTNQSKTTTMVDKIPWDTSVFSLIFSLFKIDF